MKKIFLAAILIFGFIFSSPASPDTLNEPGSVHLQPTADSINSLKFDIGIHPTKPKPEPETPWEKRSRLRRESAPIGTVLFLITLFGVLILGKKKTK